MNNNGITGTCAMAIYVAAKGGHIARAAMRPADAALHMHVHCPPSGHRSARGPRRGATSGAVINHVIRTNEAFSACCGTRCCDGPC